LEQYPNVNKVIAAGTFVSAFDHFCKIGYVRHTIINDKDLEKVQEVFDKEYYLEEYKDIKKSYIDLVEHYCIYGWKEFRNPSEDFNTKYYLEKYPDVKKAGINPLLHYVDVGKKENRSTLPVEKKSTDIKLLTNLFNTEAVIPEFITNEKIDIIIPVYNGREFLKPLFKSLIKNTTLPYRLLVCDDKSSDEKVLPLLYAMRDKNKNIDITVLENEENLGFIKTVNRLASLTHNHFVLLNTDTELPPNWIERLMYPIFEMDNIASTTPFTNAGTICSFPNYLEDNEIHDNMSVKTLDSYFQYVNFENNYIEIPTGVGFCMGVNKDLVDEIGMFDEIFGKGYAEENDWCQRAIVKGYKNIHVPNLFVYHKHGGSFTSEEKQNLIAKNSVILNKRYPSYNRQVQVTIEKNELEHLRNMLMFRMEAAKNHSVLIVDHALGGGANHYRDDEIKKRFSHSQVICLLYFEVDLTKKYQLC